MLRRTAKAFRLREILDQIFLKTILFSFPDYLIIGALRSLTVVLKLSTTNVGLHPGYSADRVILRPLHMTNVRLRRRCRRLILSGIRAVTPIMITPTNQGDGPQAVHFDMSNHVVNVSIKVCIVGSIVPTLAASSQHGCGDSVSEIAQASNLVAPNPSAIPPARNRYISMLGP
jgi:hypothetical protein